MEKFNSAEVQTQMGVIEGLFDEFGTTLNEINTLVESLVQNGNNSAIHGYVGGDLFSIWDNNASTFDTFKKNFQNWSEVVQIIAANNSNFVVDAAAIYRDTGKSMDGVAEARALYADGTKSIDDLTKGTSYDGYVSSASSSGEVWTSYEAAAAAGFSNILTASEFAKRGSTKEKYGTYQNYLNAMYEKYVGNGNADSLNENSDPTGRDEPNSNNTNEANSTSSSGIYSVNTKNVSADDMYQDALKLKDEIYYEEEYLLGYKGNMEYAKKQLEAAYSNGTITDRETYESLLSEYNQRIKLCDEQIELRSNMYNSLYDITRNGITDGDLKNARDWGSNDIVTASKSLETANEYSDQIVSLRDIVSETNSVDGSTSIGALAYAGKHPSFRNEDYGVYMENINEIFDYQGNSVSDLTWRSAYAAAGSNVETISDYPGVYLFNAKDYLTQSLDIYSGGNDWVASELGAFDLESGYNGYDSVYDSNTGKFYTYGEFCDYVSNKQN